MLLHNRSSSAIVSLLTGSLLEEPRVVCVSVYCEIGRCSWFLGGFKMGNPTMGEGTLKEKNQFRTGFEKQRLSLAMLMLALGVWLVHFSNVPAAGE